MQIIENIFTNSLKYTQSGSITVSAKYNKELTLAIKDTGYVIPKNQLNNIFKPFFRAEGNESKIPGFGMGLAIVEGLVKALKGSITVNSTEGKGSEFIIKLPVGIEYPTNEKEYNITPIKNLTIFSNLSLLIIDDNELSCSTRSSMMTTHGVKCETTTDPTRGLQKLARKPYDLVLCDLQMPIITGDELLKFIRENEGPNQATPFIFISAYADRFSIMGAKILSKPVRSTDIFDEISNIFSHKK
jgi:CheY-like chemotaxis protein